MSWGLRVHAGGAAKEGVPALLDEVFSIQPQLSHDYMDVNIKRCIV